MPSKEVVIKYTGDASSAVKASQQVEQAADKAHGKVGSSSDGARTKLSALFGQVQSNATGFDSLKGSAETLEGGFSGLQSGLLGAGAAAGAAVGIFGSLFKTQSDVEEVQLRLNQALLGNPAAGTAEDMNALAEATMKYTTYDDEAVVSAETFLITAGHTEAQIRRLIPAIADYAAFTGKDLKEATQNVEKAIQGKTKALDNDGFYVDKANMKGRELEAVTDALAKAQGFAAKEAETNAGKIKRLGVAWGEIKEKVADVVLPQLGLATTAFGLTIDKLGQDHEKLNGFVSGFIKNGADQAQVTQFLTTVMGHNKDVAFEMAKQFADAGFNVDGFTQASIDSKAAVNAHAEAVAKFDEQMATDKSTVDDAVSSLKNLWDAQHRGQDAALDLLNANDRLRDAQEKVTDAEQKLADLRAAPDYKAGTKEEREAVEAVEKAHRDVIKSGGDLEQQMITSATTWKTQGESFDTIAGKVADMGTKYGLSKDAVQAIVDKLRDEWNPAVSTADQATALRDSLADLKAKGYDVGGALRDALAAYLAWNTRPEPVTYTLPGGSIKYAAAGADFGSGEWGIVGEKGPELIHFGSPAQVRPPAPGDSSSRPSTAAPAPTTITINISGARSPQSTGHEVWRTLNRLLPAGA